MINQKHKKQQNHMLKDIVKLLEDSNLIIETLSLGETKYMVTKQKYLIIRIILFHLFVGSV